MRSETTIRVIHVSPTAFGVSGIFGGGERYPLELAKALAHQRGVHCELVTFGSEANEEEIDGLRVRVLKARAHLHDHPAHPIGGGLLRAVRGFDVVHVHHLRSSSSRLAAIPAKLSGARLAVTDHGLTGGNWFGLLPRLFDRFLTVSQYSADVLAAPAARTSVIYGGADERRLYPGTEAREGVLFVGRITPHKGLDRLIQSLPDGARLTVAGTGGHDPRPPERDYPDYVRRLAADGGKDVDFAGAVPDDELPVRYRSAAVVAMPSVYRTCYGKKVEISELLGLTALEAMASGTPVVASAVGGLTEIVVDGTTGYVVDPDDGDALHKRLSILLDDPEHARRLGEAARQHVLERFTWTACARRCVAAYESMLAR